MLTLAKSPRLTLKKSSINTQHVTLAQVYHALRKQTIEVRPTICASFWRYRESGYCFINANGVTKRVSPEVFFHKVFLSGFGV